MNLTYLIDSLYFYLKTLVQLVRPVLFALGFISALVLSPYAVATEPVSRTGGAVSLCVGCHGIPEYHTAFPYVYKVPLIAGQSPGYLVSALKAYRSGERKHPTMQSISASLSDKEIANLAAYYGNKE